MFGPGSLLRWGAATFFLCVQLGMAFSWSGFLVHFGSPCVSLPLANIDSNAQRRVDKYLQSLVLSRVRFLRVAHRTTLPSLAAF
mmetsp:Transcript_39172/g.112378  ORF Transcript_39172/g.112378 Transcript_39172/m.112378 type:complete len:84 (-) Transcript_39172:316-567(-)